jgi:hypothetical protein
MGSESEAVVRALRAIREAQRIRAELQESLKLAADTKRWGRLVEEALARAEASVVRNEWKM